MTITYRSGVSIGELVFYTPSLIIAVCLTLRHGCGRSAGWLFLVIFSLARLVGAAMQLATISNPTNVGLYTGYAILQSIGLSPLMLAMLGLLSHVIDNINLTHRTLISTRIVKSIELIITAGFILGIVGGVNASDGFSKTGKYAPGSLSKASEAIFVVCFLAIVVSTVIIILSISYASHGEQKIAFAVAVSLPFLLVRLTYSILSTFAHNKNFNLLTGSVTVLLGISLIEEIVIVVIFEGVGHNVPQVSEHIVPEGAQIAQDANRIDYVSTPLISQPSGFGLKVLKVLSCTIIGRLASSLILSNKNHMQMQEQFSRHR